MVYICTVEYGLFYGLSAVCGMVYSMVCVIYDKAIPVKDSRRCSEPLLWPWPPWAACSGIYNKRLHTFTTWASCNPPLAPDLPSPEACCWGDWPWLSGQASGRLRKSRKTGGSARLFGRSPLPQGAFRMGRVRHMLAVRHRQTDERAYFKECIAWRRGIRSL